MSQRKKRQKKKTLSIKMKKKRRIILKCRKGKIFVFSFSFLLHENYNAIVKKDVVLMKNNNEKQILMSFLFVLSKI